MDLQRNHLDTGKRDDDSARDIQLMVSTDLLHKDLHNDDLGRPCLTNNRN